jgi:DNA-binding NarL/FixJ family response regulator
MIRVLVADDQALIRESLELMLNLKTDIRVVAAAADGHEVLEALDREAADVVLLDVSMPGMGGLGCLHLLRERHPQLPVIMLSTYDDEHWIVEAARQGARGYLLKTVPSEELAKAIHTVSDGGTILTPDLASKLFSGLANDEPVRDKPKLNRSESAIVRLIAAGLSNKEITTQMQLSEGTVRNYISSILLKLNLRDRTQVAIWAVQHPDPQGGG